MKMDMKMKMKMNMDMNIKIKKVPLGTPKTNKGLNEMRKTKDFEN
jgi:hypothetical protein